MNFKRYQKRYGQWAGNPKGYPPDYSKCAKEIMSGYLFFQCSRRNGHGPDGCYCKQHAKMIDPIGYAANKARRL